jgi:hypothetical protein
MEDAFVARTKSGASCRIGLGNRLPRTRGRGPSPRLPLDRGPLVVRPLPPLLQLHFVYLFPCFIRATPPHRRDTWYCGRVAMADISIEWVVPESLLAEHVAALEVGGGVVAESGDIFRPRPDEAADYATAGFEPLTFLVATAPIVILLQTILRMIRDRRVGGGTVIDVRGGKVRIRPVATMPSGRLILIQESATTVHEKAEEDLGKALTELLQKVAGLPRGSPGR